MEDELELEADVVKVTRENITMVSEKTGRSKDALLRALQLSESHNEVMYVQLYRPPWRRDGYNDPAARIEIDLKKRASDLEHHSDPRRRGMGAPGAQERV